MSASDQPPSGQAQAWARATVLTACRTGRLDLDEAERRLQAIFEARTYGDLYAAIDDLPHPPAPLHLPHDMPARRRRQRS